MAAEFFTSDVDLAAFLRCRGLRYLRVQRSPQNLMIADFVFAESAELFEGLAAWHEDEVMHQFAQRRRKLYQLARRAVEG